MFDLLVLFWQLNIQANEENSPTGSTFCFRHRQEMNTKYCGQNPASGAMSHARLLTKQRILLADDDHTFVHLAEVALAAIAGRLDTANDGAKAMGLLLEREYDAAILDLSMPLTDGFRLLAFIRSTRHLRDLPVVVVTSRSDKYAGEEVARLGADLMLIKPIVWREFPRYVSDAIRGRAAAKIAA